MISGYWQLRCGISTLPHSSLDGTSSSMVERNNEYNEILYVPFKLATPHTTGELIVIYFSKL